MINMRENEKETMKNFWKEGSIKQVQSSLKILTSINGLNFLIQMERSSHC